MSENPEYYEGAHEGFVEEVEKFSEAVTKFVNGDCRIWQWENLIRDYRQARSALLELREIVDSWNMTQEQLLKIIDRGLK